MHKWLKYSILISILVPLLMGGYLSAQEYKLQKFVFGNGGMVGARTSLTVGPEGPVLSGLSGQAAIEKRDARSILHGESYDLYQGFWTPEKLNLTSVNTTQNENMDRVMNYPNPFSTSTTIKYEIDASSYVSLKIYDMVGNEIIQLYEGFQSSGVYTFPWNAKNRSGMDVGSGSYLYELSVQPAATAGTSPFKPYKVRKVMVIVK